MNVQLIQVDGKWPNLALMKLSAYHKKQGDTVGFNTANPDRVYISVIFSKNYAHAKGIPTWYPNAECQIGGPGIGVPSSLPDEAEHIMPDYSLYPDLDYSMGFTTRGCFRKCPFCPVPKLEGVFREHAPVEEFHNPAFKKITIMDNNFLYSENRTRTLDYIRDNKLKVCIHQGMDARILTEEIAVELASVRSYSQHFKRRSYIFAWDNIKDEVPVMRGLDEMIKAGVKPKQLMVYVLIGFDTEYWQDIYRLRTLVKLGVTPFSMIYNFKRTDPALNAIAKWSNRRYYTVCDIEDYRPLKRLARTRKIFAPKTL